jgi:diguanylate cyclase (GGDEF)-like protein
MARLQILLADDSSTSRMVIRRLLVSCDYDVVEVNNGADALAALQKEDGPHIAILDWQMPGLSGVEVCKQVRARSDERYVYMILVTAREDKKSLLDGLAAGADDYLVKPFDSDELTYRLRTGVRIIELEDRLRMAQARLEHEARHDGLTGILNRNAILETLHKELERSHRMGHPTAVIMADVDHFKRINDTHGHAAGDQVLRSVAEAIRSSVRPYDSVGRYGGEEFLIVLPETSPADVETIAERVRTAAAANPILIDGRSVVATLSLGIDTTEPEDAMDAERMISAADMAMYQAKSAGRNRVHSRQAARTSNRRHDAAALVSTN